jgi:hypothetical protein
MAKADRPAALPDPRRRGAADLELGAVRSRPAGLAGQLPVHRYYADVAARIDASRAALPVARKLARRSHHLVRRLGDRAYAPVPAGR